MSIFPMFTHTLGHLMLAKIEAVEVDGCALLSIELGGLPRICFIPNRAQLNTRKSRPLCGGNELMCRASHCEMRVLNRNGNSTVGAVKQIDGGNKW
jgi:hypothetical protein